MKVIVGLGNPGPRYDRTRHNAGFMVVDRLAARHAPSETPKSRFNALTIEAPIRGQRCILVKPITYMNRSGPSAADAVRFFKAEPLSDLLVVVDDVAIPCGSIRLRPGGGAGGHNGLADIQRALGSDQYPRLRVGIDRSPPFMAQEDYVLGKFTEEQWALVGPSIEAAADAVETFVIEGLAQAMNRHNTRARPGAPEDDQDLPGLDPGWLPRKD